MKGENNKGTNKRKEMKNRNKRTKQEEQSKGDYKGDDVVGALFGTRSCRIFKDEPEEATSMTAQNQKQGGKKTTAERQGVIREGKSKKTTYTNDEREREREREGLKEREKKVK